jgi:hypothetical protein
MSSKIMSGRQKTANMSIEPKILALSVQDTSTDDHDSSVVLERKQTTDRLVEAFGKNRRLADFAQ